MTLDLRRSPLAHRSPIATPDARLSLAELVFSNMYILRGAPDVTSTALSSVTKVSLPTDPGTSNEAAGVNAIWLGPDEWLIVDTDTNTQEATKESLRTAFAAIKGQFVDVSDYYTTLTITGDAARETLAKITMVDLHPRAFAKGHAISSIFGQTGAWLQMTDDETGSGIAFSLYVRRSMADYLWCLIAEGGREFGLQPQEPIGLVKLHLPHFEKS